MSRPRLPSRDDKPVSEPAFDPSLAVLRGLASESARAPHVVCDHNHERSRGDRAGSPKMLGQAALQGAR
jgi:hypothetical protein